MLGGWVGSLGELLRVPRLDSSSWHGRARMQREVGGGSIPGSVKGMVCAPISPITVSCPKMQAVRPSA